MSASWRASSARRMSDEIVEDGPPPETPAEAYTGLMAACVTATVPDFESGLLASDGTWPNAPAATEVNAFVGSLDDAQRRTLLDICRGQRAAAIHNVLSHLEWKLAVGHLDVTVVGEPLPIDWDLFHDDMGALDDAGLLPEW